MSKGRRRVIRVNADHLVLTHDLRDLLSLPARLIPFPFRHEYFVRSEGAVRTNGTRYFAMYVYVADGKAVMS